MKNVATKAPAAPDNAPRNGNTANTANTAAAATSPQIALTRTEVSNALEERASSLGGGAAGRDDGLRRARSVSASSRSISSSEEATCPSCRAVGVRARQDVAVPRRLDPQQRQDLATVRAVFLAAEYTAEAIAELLGPVATAALARNETVPARRACRAAAQPAAALVRLFLLQDTLAAGEVPSLLEPATRLGMLVRDGEEVRARLDVRPHDEDFWVVADLGSGLDGRVHPVPTDHVLGVGGASVSLAELTVRQPVVAALDLGTGSGVQALHLSRHAQAVVATDVLPRALDLAAYSAALSEVELDLRAGSLFAPVGGEQFDLIVSNPPFAVGAGSARTYRDGGLPADDLCRQLVGAAPRFLRHGGYCQLLANWVHLRGQDWRERVESWLPPHCDALVVQREVLDPAAYVSLWLHDSGEVAAPDYLQRYERWLDELAGRDAEGIGFGWITLRRVDAEGSHRVLDWPTPVDSPLGPHIAEDLARVAWLRAQQGDLRGSVLRVADDVTQESIGQPGAEDPTRLVLRRSGGLRPARAVDTATAALVGACDGTLPVGVLLAAVAELLQTELASLAGQVLPTVAELVSEGFLSP
jgi:Methyltransferase small domain